MYALFGMCAFFVCWRFFKQTADIFSVSLFMRLIDMDYQFAIFVEKISIFIFVEFIN